MRNYELMVIFDLSADERTVALMMEKYLAPTVANGGSAKNVDVWGERRLAYDILKCSEGIYVVIDMTTTPEVALEVNRRTGIDETTPRTKLLRPDIHRADTTSSKPEEPTWSEIPPSLSSVT